MEKNFAPHFCSGSCSDGVHRCILGLHRCKKTLSEYICSGTPRHVLSGTSVWRPQSRYTVSRTECRIKFPQNQRCRAKIALDPPPNQGLAPVSGPPYRTFLSFAAGRGRSGLVDGIAALWGSENGSRYRVQGGIATTVTPVALLCATKDTFCTFS